MHAHLHASWYSHKVLILIDIGTRNINSKICAPTRHVHEMHVHVPPYSLRIHARMDSPNGARNRYIYRLSCASDWSQSGTHGPSRAWTQKHDFLRKMGQVSVHDSCMQNTSMPFHTQYYTYCYVFELISASFRRVHAMLHAIRTRFEFLSVRVSKDTVAPE